jgi:hypothetical protein
MKPQNPTEPVSFLPVREHACENKYRPHVNAAAQLLV